jgi:hypothetical protein
MQSFEHLSPDSRVWIYQSNRPFTSAEVAQLRPSLQRFAEQWISHNRQLKAFADLFYDQFIVLMVDESQADASGCSIDKSVAFLKEIQAAFGVDLYDRLNFAYMEDGKAIGLARDEMQNKLNTGELTADSLVFDNLVATKEDFDKAWLKPLHQSWHVRVLDIKTNSNTA